MAPIDARKTLEQIRRNKNKKKTTGGTSTNKSSRNVTDLRQLIAKKNSRNTKTNEKSPSGRQVASGRITKTTTRSASNGNSRDLRDSNKRLASRRNLSQTREDRSSNNRTSARVPTRGLSSNNNSKKTTTTSNGGSSTFKTIKVQRQYYIPPHMQHQQPTYIIAPAAAPAPLPQSNLAMDNVHEPHGASVLISNLLPCITQSEIIELFSDVGVLTAVNMINATTALVTYQNSSDAVKAVKQYNNRQLDGHPMSVNMMPNSTPASNVRSRIGRPSVMSGHPAPMEVSFGARRF